MDVIGKMRHLIAHFDKMVPSERNQAFVEMEELTDRLTYEDKLAIQPQTTDLMRELLAKARELKTETIAGEHSKAA